MGQPQLHTRRRLSSAFQVHCSQFKATCAPVYDSPTSSHACNPASPVSDPPRVHPASCDPAFSASLRVAAPRLLPFTSIARISRPPLSHHPQASIHSPSQAPNLLPFAIRSCQRPRARPNHPEIPALSVGSSQRPFQATSVNQLPRVPSIPYLSVSSRPRLPSSSQSTRPSSNDQASRSASHEASHPHPSTFKLPRLHPRASQPSTVQLPCILTDP